MSIASLLFCTAILLTYALRAARRGRVRHPRLGDAPGSALVPGWAMEAFYWALDGPGRILGRLRVDPDVLTFLALACSLASLPLIAWGRLAEGAVCVGVGGILDALDGLVARLRGRASPAGAVLDSVLDRLSDSAPFAGLAVLYRGNAATMLVPIAALTASSLVSYARAKADLHGLHLPAGPMRRHERLVFLVLALLLGPFVPREPRLAPGVPYPITLAGVAFIAAAAFVGAFLLVVRTRAALAPAPLRAPRAPAERAALPPDAPRSPSATPARTAP